MKFSLSLLCGLSLLLPTVLAHPLDLPFKLTKYEIENLEDTLERRASGIVDVTGAPGPTQIRYEIRQLQSQQPNQFTLFILAMKQFQAAAQTDVTGYYQIASIHGVPRVNYNNVGPCSGCNTANGYCTHDSVLFPAWHRTYMALFEQELSNVANTIANSWPVSGQPQTRAQMQTAATQLRLPYWDWAAHPPNNGPMFPTAVSAKTITVNTPTGSQTIANPLYSYHLPQTNNLVYEYFTSWPNTLRWPTSDASNAASNEAGCIAGLNAIRPSLQDSVYTLFSSCSNYLYFSNDLSYKQSGSTCTVSLEGIHDIIHSVTGGKPTNQTSVVGHMHYLPEAAFDPVFFLHHAMVDRLFAMWQTVHSSSYGANQAAPHNTWTIEEGSNQGPNSPLTPFYQSGSTFWNTNSIKDWTVFHYTYPEFVDSSGSASAIASYVNALYGPKATATAGSTKRTAAPEPKKEETTSANIADKVEGLTTHLETSVVEVRSAIFHPPKGAVAANGSTYEYIASIQTPRYNFNGSYVIYIFMGEPESEDPSSWLLDPNMVGPMGVLSDPGMHGKKTIIQGAVPLTRTLTQKLGSGALSELSEAVVGPFLQNALQWRILGPTGDAIDPDSLEGFLVSVLASTATNPAAVTELPKYSELIPLTIATHGKKGGLVQSTLSELGIGALI